ncbi:MAG: aminotransferase class I/II-fold pyridoxal phosphate-dependent enzyme, partial [Lachnospiraceae bacterium]|nr:aminotransferase class I/II-fold pyridoxal phosphate-dependent enzyme [Lachnospiraceae bacterium]
LLARLAGRVGFFSPTFEEYPNRYSREKAVSFVPDNKNYGYTAEDLIRFFEDKEIQNLIVVNPDNPSGNYIPKTELLNLIEWAKKKEIRLILDESFVDFADDAEPSFIQQEILSANEHLYVMKSISQSFGVPGLRLGILASGDTAMIEKLKKDVAIWNINSFAEFYMQIEEKYQKDYAEALKLLRVERARFQEELNSLSGLRVIPSQANYIMVELTRDITAKCLTKNLLVKHNMLVKDLTGKIPNGQYLRLTVRNKEDNDKLIAAFKKELLERN